MLLQVGIQKMCKNSDLYIKWIFLKIRSTSWLVDSQILIKKKKRLRMLRKKRYRIFLKMLWLICSRWLHNLLLSREISNKINTDCSFMLTINRLPLEIVRLLSLIWLILLGLPNGRNGIGSRVWAKLVLLVNMCLELFRQIPALNKEWLLLLIMKNIKKMRNQRHLFKSKKE